MTLRPRPRRREDGAAAVEFALVLLVLLYLVFGIIQYGLYFWATNATSSAAREGLRRMVVGDCQDITGKLETLAVKQVGGAGEVVEVNPDPYTIPSTTQIGDQVTIVVKVEYIDLNFPFIPLPDDDDSTAQGEIIRTADGRLEDTNDSEVCG